MIKAEIVEETIEKIPLGRLRLKWEDCMKRDFKALDPRANWKEVAEDRESWRNICCDINFLKISRTIFFGKKIKED